MPDFRASPIAVATKVSQRSSAVAGSMSLTTEAIVRSVPSDYPGSPRVPRKETSAFWFKPIAPFSLKLTVWALRRRPGNLMDRWDGHSYRRVLILGGKPVDVEVTQKGPLYAPRLCVRFTGNQPAASENASVKKALERLLGLKLDLSGFYQLANGDPKLGVLVDRFRGVKPPRFPTLFEALANAIACQQMSLSLGILLLSRLTQEFGVPIQGTAGRAHAFPQPEDLAGLPPETFRKLGFSRQKGRALIALAQVFGGGSREWETFEALDNQAVVERLLELRGIGRWSAEYVLLRGLGRLDVYPGDDVGARNNLKRWLSLRRILDYEGVRRITAKWQPYAGLVYFHMLLDGLTAAGHLEPETEALQAGGAK